MTSDDLILNFIDESNDKSAIHDRLERTKTSVGLLEASYLNKFNYMQRATTSCPIEKTCKQTNKAS